MDTIVINNRSYYLPATLTDVQRLIANARESHRKIRVCGSGHSVRASIEPDAGGFFGEENLFIMLSKLNGVKTKKITEERGTVIVEAGCHLGYDPFDPTGISTKENSLFAQLDVAGYALPDMGGITHQTVGGFLSTGSSGGSLQYSFWDALQSITFIPADSDNPQPITVRKPDSLFYAVGVSMGLLGIIVSAEFTLERKYNIKGQESITLTDECAIDMSGQGGKISLEQFLKDAPYNRLLWYPQPLVGRVVVWQAERIAPVPNFKPKPYQEFEPLFGSQLLPQFLADAVYTGIGRWPRWLGDLLGTNTPLYRKAIDFVNQAYYPVIFPKLLPLFVPTNHESSTHFGEPQTFQDVWYEGLPMDNGIGDNLFPVEFTELWIPMKAPGTVANVLKALNELFDDFYKSQPRIADGSFCVELYAAKKSKFWLSPSYGSDVLRVDIFWFKRNLDSPVTNYFPLFWEKLSEFDFRCHWGKYLPAAAGAQGADYLTKQYEKFDDFLDLRTTYDPQGIFLNKYWEEHLGIAPVRQIAVPVLKAPIQPDANGYYHPKNENDISDLIKYAIANQLKVRVRGAGQSVSKSIYTDNFYSKTNGPDGIVIMLDNMRKVLEIVNEKDGKYVTVQAGCNLGFDPYDPVNISTEENSLFYQLREAGLAIPNVSDAIHQTVGGFISTGSAAGSTYHSFLESVLSISLIDGEGYSQTFSRPNPDDSDNPFYGVVVSMGLMGVIYSVTLRCVDFFHIKGRELVINDEEKPLPIYSKQSYAKSKNDKLPMLEDVLRNVEFARVIWWPFDAPKEGTKAIAEKDLDKSKSSKRIVLWEARQMKKPTPSDPGDYDQRTGNPDDFKPKPYRPGFYPSFMPPNLDQNQKKIVELATQLAVSAIFKVVDKWPKILLDLGNKINLDDKERDTKELQKMAEAAWPRVYTQLLNVFMPINDIDNEPPENPPQEFWDNWLNGLNNDKNEYSNNLLLANRTEVWVPLEQTGEVINMLEAFYREQFLIDANLTNKNAANVCYVNEILGAKKDSFWLSPAYQQDSVRINFYSLLAANDDPCDYFQQFWDLFFINKVDFRLHWGYFLPKPNSPQNHCYLKHRYQKWDDFIKLRAKMDPHKVFVNKYWEEHLGIDYWEKQLNIV
ncbi:MAG: FAD-binding protein [Chitinophagaceae bacterium]|nr:MAG: FAD-binding protein [Chitinophagaceae bacterium]